MSPTLEEFWWQTGDCSITYCCWGWGKGKATEIVGYYFPMGGFKFVLLDKNYIHLYT